MIIVLTYSRITKPFAQNSELNVKFCVKCRNYLLFQNVQEIQGRGKNNKFKCHNFCTEKNIYQACVRSMTFIQSQTTSKNS